MPPTLAGALLLTVLAGLALPRATVRTAAEPAGSPLARDRTLVLGAIAAALTVGSQAMFYGFGSIHWAALGFSGTAIGVLWAFGVVSEIALFAAAPRVLPTVTPTALLASGAAIGAVLWASFPLGETFAFFALNSLLHAGSFGAAHLGIQRMIGDRVTDAQQGRAQGLAYALAGPVMAAATFASGALYGAFSGLAFLAMAAMCVGGLVAAVAARQPHSSGEGGETIEPV